MFTGASPQGDVFGKLGLPLMEVPQDLASETHAEAYFFTQENSALALADVEYLFVIPFGDDPVAAILADPLLANVPAVVNKQVYAVPTSSFRLDYYSMPLLADFLVSQFGG